MKLIINYFENEISFEENIINVIEVENQKYFYRIVNDLNECSNGVINDNINFFDANFNNIDLSGKIKMVIDYFNIELNDKKTLNEIEKFILKNVDDKTKKEIINLYLKILKNYNSIANKLEIPLIYNDEIQYDKLIKIIGYGVDKKQDLLDNLLLLIDIERIFKLNRLIVFVNLKQYLSFDEIVELYKYSIYNDVKILLIDSTKYDKKCDYEKKLIIDSELDEFAL